MENKDVLAILAALAQETRLRVYRLLVAAGPDGLTPGKIGEQLDLAPATLSFHLKELSRAGLITSQQKSRFIYYSANYKAMNDVIAFLTENCCAGLPCEASPVKSCIPISHASRKRKESA